VLHAESFENFHAVVVEPDWQRHFDDSVGLGQSREQQGIERRARRRVLELFFGLIPWARLVHAGILHQGKIIAASFNLSAKMVLFYRTT
jgi:hypothetical protein